MFCGRAEVVICTEQYQIVFAAELNEDCVDGSNLNPMTTARIADLRSFNMVVSVWLQESKRGKPLNKLASRLRSRKALKQFLQYQPGSEDLICPFKGVLQSLDFGHRSLGVSAEGERPDTGIYEQAHSLRARSAL